MNHSPIDEEVRYVSEKGMSTRYHQFKAQLHNGKDWIQVYNVLSVNYVRDFADSFGEIVYVTIQLAAGDYIFDFLPNTRTLKLTLVDRVIMNGGIGNAVSVTYNANVLSQDTPDVEIPTKLYDRKNLLNQSGLINVELELFDEATYRVRMESVGFIARNTTPINVLRTMLGNTTHMKGADNRSLIKGVEVYPGTNETVRRQIDVPHGLELYNLAHYLQDRGGGIYATGCGCYLHQGTWYVFPTHNVTMSDYYKRALTIVMVPSQRTQMEKTYRSEGDSITVIATGSNKTFDFSQSQKLNNATGARFINVERLLGESSTAKDNKVVLSRNQNLSEFTTSQLDGDNLSNTRFAKERATSNAFKVMSELAKGDTRYFDIEWRFGDIEQLIPGMPVTILASDNNTVKQYRGVLVNASALLTPNDKGAVKENFVGSIRMGINVELNPI